MKRLSFKDLLGEGLITGIIGDLPPEERIRPALVVWARSPPKKAFRAFVLLAKRTSEHPLRVYVDDVCSRAVMKRSVDEQSSFNEEYRRFFEGSGVVLNFSSSIYGGQEEQDILPQVVEMAERVSLAEFVHCLPEKKRAHLEQFSFAETLHMLLELLLFERVKEECNILLSGKFSQSIVLSHRHISKDPLAAVILPKLSNEDELTKYISALAAPRG
jgi:hypothetical protein